MSSVCTGARGEGAAERGTRGLVVFTDVTDLDLSPSRRMLAEAGFTVVQLHLDQDRVIPAEYRGAVALVVGFATVDDDILEQLPQLKYITTCSVGTDMVDASAAAARGIPVANLAGVSTEEVAVHAIALLLALERDLFTGNAVARTGGWIADFTPMPRRLSERTLGVYGCGRIGTAFVARTRALYGRVLVCDPYAPRLPEGVEVVDFERLLAESDAVSIHTPLTAETQGRFADSEFARMRPGAVLVNTARGAIIDAEAARRALEDGRLGALGTDVLIGDPPEASNPLLHAPHTIVTPHVAFKSDVSMRGYTEWPGKNVLAWAGLGPDPREDKAAV